MKNNLTSKQKDLLDYLKSGKLVYVFQKDKGYSFGKERDTTHNRVYITMTVKSLLNKGLVRIRKCFINSKLDNCIGIVELLGKEGLKVCVKYGDSPAQVYPVNELIHALPDPWVCPDSGIEYVKGYVYDSKTESVVGEAWTFLPEELEDA